MKKNLRLFVLCMGVIVCCQASLVMGEERNIVIPVDRTESLAFEFVANGYRIQGAKDLVSVVIDKASSQIRIRGVKPGKCEVEVLNLDGAKEGLFVNVDVIENDLDAIRNDLRKRLQLAGIPPLEFSKGKRKLVISGTIDNRDDWAKLKNILALDDFNNKVESLVEFQVDSKVIEALRKQLRDSGLSLVELGQPCEPGSISMRYEHNIVTISGTVFSEMDRDKIQRVLGANIAWLEIVDVPKNASDSPMAQAVTNVGLDESLVEMTVSVLAFSEDSIRKRENANPLEISGTFRGLFNLITGQWDRDVAIGASLDTTVKFVYGDTMSREEERATMRFRCNSTNQNEVHIGGKLYIRMSTKDADGNISQETKDFDYGFIIKKKSARRTGTDQIEVGLDIRQIMQPRAWKDGSAGDFMMDENKFDPLITCKFEETTALGGYKKMNENTMLPSGFPGLRNIPIIKWFASSESREYQDKRLMMLVSVRIINPNEKIAEPLKKMEDITIDVTTPNQVRIDERRKSSGVYWLLPWTWFSE